MGRALTDVPTDGFSSTARKALIVDTLGSPITGSKYAVKYRGNFSAAQTSLQVLAAPGSGYCLYITDILFSNGATAGTLSLLEVSGPSSAYIIPPQYMAVNSSVPKTFKTPLKLNQNFSLNFTSVTSTTHSIVVSGYIGPVLELTTTSTTSSTSTSTSTSTSSSSTSTSTTSTSSSTSSTSSSTSTSTSTTSSTSSSTLSTTSSTSSTSSTLSTTSSTSSTLSTTSSTSSTLSTTTSSSTSSTSSTLSTTSSTSSTSSTISTMSTVSTFSTMSTMSTLSTMTTPPP